MKLKRCQSGDVETSADFRVDSTGSCGPGIYAMLANDKRLQRFYTNKFTQVYTFDVPDSLVKVIKGRGLTTFQAIRERIEMETEKGYRVFICKHGGINVPKGKQVVIIDHEIIRNIQKFNNK